MLGITQTEDPYGSLDSVESGFRIRRFTMFEELVEPLMLASDRRVRILDLGGTHKYWSIARPMLERYRGRISIHLVNQERESFRGDRVFTRQTADACSFDLLQGERFDIVHSNSVIEHVGAWDRIEAFAENVHRLGDKHFIQTPNYWFPLEPHFRFPAFQWLPVSTRTWLLRRRDLGFYDRQTDYLSARSVVDSIRLLTPSEMRRLFPGSAAHIEWVFGLPKSIIMTGCGKSALRKVAAPTVQPAMIELAGPVSAA